MKTTLRLLLGVVFCGAGALKFLQPLEGVLAVGAYRLLPAPLAVAGGLWLPGLEVAVGAALLAGIARRGAAVVAAGLAAVFLLFTAQAWARGLDVSCGCLGPLSIVDRAGPAMMLVDGALLLFALALLLVPDRLRPGNRIRP